MSSSTRFPALRLPLLPLQQIIKDLTPIDIFFLALCSKKTKETLQRLSLKLDVLDLTQEDNEFYIRFSKGAFGYKVNLETVSPEEMSENREGRNPLKADEKLYEVSYEHWTLENPRIRERNEDFVVLKEAVYTISKSLSEVFTAQKVCLAFSDVPKEVALPVVSTRFRNVQDAYLAHNKTQKLTSDDLSMLLDNCSIHRLKLDWSVEKGVKFRKSLRYPEMILYKAHWLTIECLLNMECVSLHAYDVRLTAEDVKRFLRNWLDGGYEKLQSVQLTHQSSGYAWRSLLDNLEEKTLLNHEDRKTHFKPQLKWNVWEIRRSDGKRAGVCASKEFTFKVL